MRCRTQPCYASSVSVSFRVLCGRSLLEGGCKAHSSLKTYRRTADRVGRPNLRGGRDGFGITFHELPNLAERLQLALAGRKVSVDRLIKDHRKFFYRSIGHRTYFAHQFLSGQVKRRVDAVFGCPRADRFKRILQHLFLWPLLSGT